MWYDQTAQSYEIAVRAPSDRRIMTGDEDQDLAYTRVLKVLGELHTSWRDYQERLGSEIVEYKKTVNNAISLLAQEALKFQSDTTKRLEEDAIERRARQAIVDSATANVREDMLTARAETLARLDATTAQNEQHERRASRKAYAMLSGVGCLIVVNVLALIALAALLISLYWIPR
jgi:hypothetical protein